MPVYYNGWLNAAGDIHAPQTPYPAPTISVQPVGASIFAGATHAMTVTAASNIPGIATLTYQWYQGVLGDGTDWVAISGATAATYTYTGVAADPLGLKFVCNVYDSRTQVTQSAAATMVIYAAVTATIAPTSGAGYAGGTVAFTATGGGGSGTYTYAWAVDAVPVSGQTAATYTHTIVGGESVTCAITSAGSTATSAAAVITAWAAPTCTIAPTSGAGYSGAVVAFTATPGGGSGTYTYQWLNNAAPISGATAATYSHTITAAGSITCTVTSSGAAVTSAAAAITMWAAPTCTITMTPASVVEGAVLSFAATAGAGSGTYTYQWNLNAVAIAGATLATYDRTTVIADNAGVITCTVTSSGASVISAGQTMVVGSAAATVLTVGNYYETNYGYDDGTSSPSYVAYGAVTPAIFTIISGDAYCKQMYSSYDGKEVLYLIHEGTEAISSVTNMTLAKVGGSGDSRTWTINCATASGTFKIWRYYWTAEEKAWFLAHDGLTMNVSFG